MVAMVEVQLGNPDSFVNGVPHDTFRLLRREAPLYRERLPDGTEFWALTKYHDVVAASSDYATFSSAKGTNIEEQGGGTQLMMVNMDPPRHTKLRALISKGFTPKMVRALDPHVREITTAIVDNVARRGECDFVTEVAAELPLQVIAELIGIPIEERHLVFEWSNQMIGLGDPEYGNSMEVATKAANAMFAYADKLASERRQNPKSDVVSVLLGAEVDAFESECAARKGLDDTRSCRRGQLIGILGKDDRITGEDLNRSRRRERQPPMCGLD